MWFSQGIVSVSSIKNQNQPIFAVPGYKAVSCICKQTCMASILHGSSCMPSTVQSDPEFGTSDRLYPARTNCVGWCQIPLLYRNSTIINTAWNSVIRNINHMEFLSVCVMVFLVTQVDRHHLGSCWASFLSINVWRGLVTQAITLKMSFYLQLFGCKGSVEIHQSGASPFSLRRDLQVFLITKGKLGFDL